MAISKFQSLRLTIYLSVKVTLTGVLSTYWNIFFSETTWPMELKVHMKTPYDRWAKIYTTCFGGMTKTAAMPIYGKKGQWSLDLVLGMWALPGLHKWWI